MIERLVRLLVLALSTAAGYHFFGVVGGIVGFVLGGMLALAHVTRNGNPDECDSDGEPRRPRD